MFVLQGDFFGFFFILSKPKTQADGYFIAMGHFVL